MPRALLRLGVNIDHIATVRNARGGDHPDPVAGAWAAIQAGADGITAHLREDRRHMRDEDMTRLQALCESEDIPLNMEMAATEEMQDIAMALKPKAICIVPERREERTTEGGLGVAQDENRLATFIAPLREAGCRISMFIEADRAQIESSAKIGAAVVELHAGALCEAHLEGDFATRDTHLKRITEAARFADEMGLEVHAGHGLDFETAPMAAAIPEVVELNIGHFLIGEAIFTGLPEAISQMRAVMDKARPPSADA